MTFKVGDEIRHRVTGERAIVSYVNPSCHNIYINGDRMDEVAPANWERWEKISTESGPTPTPAEALIEPERTPISVTTNGHDPIPPTTIQVIRGRAQQVREVVLSR